MKTKIKTKSSTQSRRDRDLAELFPTFLSDEDKFNIKDWEAGNEGGIIDPSQALILPDDFDIRALMDEAKDPVTGTLRDLRVDDRDLPLAKNFYDFSFNIIGKDSNPPWARQLWTGAMLNGEICPCCSKKSWLDIHNVPKDFKSRDLPEFIQFLENGVCPKCKRTKLELINKYGLKGYMELVLVWGQRSGKSETAAFLSSYQTHRFLKFPKFSTLTTALQSSTPLTATFVSLTFTKAVSLLWTPLYNKISASSWFNQYHEMLDYYGAKHGVELYRKKDLFIKYFTKGLHLYPSHPNGPILRGDTRFLSVVDELGLFPLPSGNEEEDEQSERANSDEAHKSLTNSLTTVQAVASNLLNKGYNSVPTALMMGVSSPMSERDKVMRLLRESKTEQGQKLILGIQLPTWEVNPHIGRDAPVITLAYERNAAKAERDFGANPPRVHSTYMSANMVSSGIFVGPPNTHSIKHMFDYPEEIYGTLIRKGSHAYPTVLTLDAGHVNNAFAITVGYFDFVTGKTHISTVLEVVPQQGRTINFNMVYKHVILPLANDLNAVIMVADRWNSLDLLHRIREDRGTNKDGKPITLSKQFSPRRKHFDFVYQMIADKNLVLPRVSPEDQKLVLELGVENFRTDLVDKPVAHLMLQCVTVKDTNDRLPPEKGEGYTDDMFRAMVLNAALIHEPKVMALLKEAVVTTKARTGMPMPAYQGRSGGMGFNGIR